MNAERNQKILEMRDSGMTLQQIAEEIGLSRERVNQIVTKSNVSAPTQVWGNGDEANKKPLYASVWRLDHGDEVYSFHPTRKEAIKTWGSIGSKNSAKLLWVQFADREGLANFLHIWSKEVATQAGRKMAATLVGVNDED
jgi:hypothetical protein